MKKDEAQHAELVDEVGVELDELRRAGDQLDEAVALQFGLNRTDLRCLGILYRRGRVTAGELAEESGLTPGAITTVLDRLERAGYANRVPDPADRRRRAASSPRSRRAMSGARIQGEVRARHAATARGPRGDRAAGHPRLPARDARRVRRPDRRAHRRGGAGGRRSRRRRRCGRAESRPAQGSDRGAARIHQGRREGDPARRRVADRALQGDVRGPGSRDHRQRRHRHGAAAPALPGPSTGAPSRRTSPSPPPCRGTSRCAAACGSSSPTSARCG